jgi:hypothetical protein
VCKSARSARGGTTRGRAVARLTGAGDGDAFREALTRNRPARRSDVECAGGRASEPFLTNATARDEPSKTQRRRVPHAQPTPDDIRAGGVFRHIDERTGAAATTVGDRTAHGPETVGGSIHLRVRRQR